MDFSNENRMFSSLLNVTKFSLNLSVFSESDLQSRCYLYDN